jgi:hypothetical protein
LDRNETGRRAHLEARLILGLRTTLLTYDIARIEEQLSLCHKHQFSGPEVAATQAELRLLVALRELCQDLNQAVGQCDLERLDALLQRAATMNVRHQQAAIAAATQKLSEFRTAQQLLNEAIEKQDRLLLVAALNFCAAVHFHHPSLGATAALLLAQILRIREIASLGIHYVEPSALQAAVTLSKELSYHDELLDDVSRLLNQSGMLIFFFSHHTLLHDGVNFVLLRFLRFLRFRFLFLFLLYRYVFVWCC